MKIFFRLLLVATVFLIVAVETAPAQRTHAYVFAAPGAARASGDSTGFLHAGGGFELALPLRVGVGGELGFVGSFSSLTKPDRVASVSGYRHFATPGRLDPYLVGGYSALIHHDTANGFHFGLGANLPLLGRLGLKFEFRGHVFSENALTSHLWQGRFALTF